MTRKHRAYYARNAGSTLHSWTEELEKKGLDVRVYTRAEEVLRSLELPTQPDIFVMHCSLNHGEELDAHETGNGTITGIVLYRRIRGCGILVPVIICDNSRCARHILKDKDDSSLRIFEPNPVRDGEELANLAQIMLREAA